MNNGLARFEHYLAIFKKQLAEAAGQGDPGLWLYQNNARTPIFMLEGLAKLYSTIHNKKRFAKIEEHFKLLEDALGAIDYYDNFAKKFAADKKAPKGADLFAASKTTEKTAALNQLLKDKRWLGKNADRLAKTRRKLRSADWLAEKDEIKAIETVYRLSIAKIDAFAAAYTGGFTDLESQVHELRRKLRWLSIYPQALQGCIQLTGPASGDKKVEKYLTPAIVNSPFNKLPDSGSNRRLLLLNKDYFLALSWMISELGRIKDLGLRLVLLSEAGKTSKTDAAAEKKLLADATAVCNTYFAEENLDRLISGIVKNKAP
ncbi:hypothetical protein BH10ACI3_BH10ACI3_02060 [soil metagenome]